MQMDGIESDSLEEGMQSGAARGGGGRRANRFIDGYGGVGGRRMMTPRCQRVR